MNQQPAPPSDPWADLREWRLFAEQWPQRELDGVWHYSKTHRARGEVPPPLRPGAYLDSALTGSRLAERLPGLLDDLLAFLDATAPTRLRPGEAGRALLGEQPEDKPWRGARTLDWLAEALRGGRAEGITLSFDSPEGEEDRFLLLTVSSCLPERAEAPLDLSITPSDSLWPASDADRVAERLLGLVESWVQPLDLLTGCVTCDRVEPHRSPWDLWYGTDHHATAPLAAERVRGYCWANLLSAGHLERLGGLKALEREATARDFEVRVLNRTSSAAPIVLVRAAGPACGVDDEWLAAMKALLAPVLMPQPYVWYEGWPLRIIRDPGTAFRRPLQNRDRDLGSSS